MKNNNKLIEYFDYFAIRIPRYPIDNYLEKENKSFIDIFKEDLEFQESIFWASPRLYNSAIHYNGDLNMFEKINNSLKNYYKRMSTRATPFGSFSGFTIGKFDYENSLNNNYTFKKNYKISYVWMNKFIKKLESTYDYIKFFKVKFNNNTYEKGYRLYLYESIDKSDISSIEYTQQINLIKQLTYNEIKISMLVDILRERYGEEHFNKIITLVMNLIECGYLISELRKERLELDGIVKKLPLLEYTSDIVVNIQFINDKIKALNYQSKFNINDAIILIKSMEKIEKSEEYIQVDTKIENFNFKLDKNIAESICEYYDWLLKSSVTKAEYSQLQEKFIASFIDKYGENTPIPIYKLYMSGFGLEELLFKLKNNSVLKLDNLNVIILKKITDCFANNQDEISLDDIDIFKSTDPIENCSTDLEIYGRVINENGRNIFVINTSNSSDTVGSSFGRFFDIIDNDSFIKALKKYYSDSDVLNLQIFHHCNNNKLQNVTRNDELLENNIKLNIYPDEKSIDINDICVVSKNNKLYLWSKSQNKRIKLVKMHMLNYMHLPNIFQTLIIIDRFNSTPIDFSMEEILDYYSYSPRIRYKNIIVKPTTWNIYKSFFSNLNEQQWKIEFDLFKKKAMLAIFVIDMT